MMDFKDIKRAASLVMHSCGPAEAAVILGSGLGGYEEQLLNPVEIGYDEIPGFPASTVSGHAGKFIVGTIRDRRVLVTWCCGDGRMTSVCGGEGGGSSMGCGSVGIFFFCDTATTEIYTE